MQEINFENKSVYFSSLGCSKNLVDSQVMLGHLGLGGFEIASTPELAEVIIINTCSFIEAAKKESIDTILELSDYKLNGNCKALVVSGCMAQRYSQALEEELPEVDLIIGTGEYNKIVPLLKALESGKLEVKSHVEIPKFIHTEYDPRINTSPFYMAWLKVSEGCNRNCTFCIIPTLRGTLRSRSVESLIIESRRFVDEGVRELNLISQDLSDYGKDLDGGNNLLQLLIELDKIEDLKWVRLFYYYPDDLTEEVMSFIEESKKICSYLDMPIQHFSNNILRRMNRKITGNEILNKVKKLKEKVSDIVIRTSIIVGFPGETEEDFMELLKGVETCEFDHLGIFRYSDEEDTPAFNFKEKVPQEIIDERFDRLYEVQKEVVQKKNSKYLGKTIEVLIEGFHDETELLIKARHVGQAPDIDGNVIINDLGELDNTDYKVEAGQFFNVIIEEVLEHDLVGKLLY